MRIVFMGTPDYAVNILKKLILEFEVVGVYTQPDKPVGRKKILTPPLVKKFIIETNKDIPFFQPTSLKLEKENIKKLKPDFIVVAAFGMILPKSILEIAPCINLHASLLPKYRGASPIQSAILNNEKFTGVTAMKMNEGLDTGDVLGFEYIKLDDKSAPEVFDELSIIAANLIIKVIYDYNKLRCIKQINALASYSPKITKLDGKIYFEDAFKIYRKYLAFFYWPGIWTEHFKLKKIGLIDTFSVNKPSEILEIRENSIVVGCKNGKIEIFEIQPNSKKTIKAIDYINGKRLKIGDNLL